MILGKMISYKVGLSLCIQGTLFHISLSFYIFRFIPVHTGNTPGRVLLLTETSVYPCAYREHMILGKMISYKVGLSLCIQGTLFHISLSFYIFRFIPVHTGNTPGRVLLLTETSVYPCAYREHSERFDKFS